MQAEIVMEGEDGERVGGTLCGRMSSTMEVRTKCTIPRCITLSFPASGFQLPEVWGCFVVTNAPVIRLHMAALARTSSSVLYALLAVSCRGSLMPVPSGLNLRAR